MDNLEGPLRFQLVLRVLFTTLLLLLFGSFRFVSKSGGRASSSLGGHGFARWIYNHAAYTSMGKLSHFRSL